MKVEWWYNDAGFHYSDRIELALARLLIRDNGTAQILTDGGEEVEFENENDASIWFLDEEYRRLDRLKDDLAEEGVLVDPRIKIPEASTKEELLAQMLIVLDPRNGVAGAQSSPRLRVSRKR